MAKSNIKFLLLNSSVYFKDIMAECRAIVVAGGTMSPVSDFVTKLICPKLTPPRVRVFLLSRALSLSLFLNFSLALSLALSPSLCFFFSLGKKCMFICERRLFVFKPQCSQRPPRDFAVCVLVSDLSPTHL